VCTETSVMLPPQSIDLAYLCDTYHHFEYPMKTLSSWTLVRTDRRNNVRILARAPDAPRETIRHAPA
jgi:hypothetical protein